MADNTKLYEHYKDVALKHFYALMMMREKLEDMINKGKQNTNGYQYLLYDAFYISGYILEGASRYVIFKYLQWNKKVEIPVQSHKNVDYLRGIRKDANNDYTGNYDYSITPRFQFKNETSAVCKRFLDQLNSHKVFEYTQSKFTGCSTEAFFCGDCDPNNSLNPNTKCPDLLKNWDVDKRYFLKKDFETMGLTISYKDIKAIEKFCDSYIIKYINLH